LADYFELFALPFASADAGEEWKQTAAQFLAELQRVLQRPTD
jgi:hypothetical protein